MQIACTCVQFYNYSPFIINLYYYYDSYMSALFYTFCIIFLSYITIEISV